MNEAASDVSQSIDRPEVIRHGMSIERIYTTPGVHPYDEVTWERRDVVQNNWKTGEIVFEQRGVEFPDFWSVISSTIVTTKYFRGAVGTDQREWSLRQLIDRVVLTYRRAGEEHGYFATPADAEVFEHELAYALLHQVFSFNSPVWFNVGTPAPQQVSACQPYHSLVSTPDGLIPIGRMVEENLIGQKVYDAHGLAEVLAVKHNGRKEVLRLTTKAGHQLDVTADHQVWKASGTGTGAFVAAGELGVGDRLSWVRTPIEGIEGAEPLEVAEAALAGWLQADGFVGQYATGTNRSLTIEAMTVNDDEFAHVLALVETVFPGVHYKVRDTESADPSLHIRRIRLYGEILRPFVTKWELTTRGDEMRVPGHLQGASTPVVAAYLRSIFQAEGYVSRHGETTAHVGFAMISPEVVRGAQALLARIGIFSRVRTNIDKRTDRKPTFVLLINNEGDQELFAELVGFVCARKNGKLAAALGRGGRAANPVKTLEIATVESLGEMDVYDIQTSSGEYLSSGNLRVHNCFILAVDDSMDSILNWYREEGMIFKGGSGAGLNLSRIRSSKELLSSGGTASGPVSFMRGADASAGTIKSGGATRRAAKMVVLDVDHPDIEEFIETKAREEDKIRALRDAGFDMDLGGKDIASVQYQNANNSVRVSDEFMRAVEEGGDFGLRARADGSVIETVDAKGLFDKIAKAAWECADPGIQYDDTINDWHTCPESGRINASNPCFTADTLVHTDKGLIRFDELLSRANAGEQFGVYTHDATSPDAPAHQMVLTNPKAYLITGQNPIVRLRFDNGMELRCTPGHRIWTANRGYVEAENLTADDQVLALDLPAPAVNADWALPATARAVAERAAGEHRAPVVVPEVWSDDLAHYLGWLIGDGSTSSTISTIYGSAEDRDEVLPRHQEFVEAFNGGRPLKVSEQANGTAQLRLARGAFRRFLSALGVTDAGKTVPSALYQAPPEIVATFLRGLFDADGTVVHNDANGSYAGLGSASRELLIGVQRLLATFGVSSRMYQVREGSDDGYAHTQPDGSVTRYRQPAGYDLRITAESLDTFAAEIGFTLSRKAQLLAEVVRGRTAYTVDRTVRLVERSDEGIELTYNLSEPRNHSYVANGVVVRNCSEYMHLDNSSCNLASLNLMKFLRDDDTFDATTFSKVVELVITAMDISICFADFPTEAIGDTTRKYRQLGIGYANLGALLMASGLPYDSDAGRALAASITSLMTGTAYKRSAELAGVVGTYEGYPRNAEGHKRVMRKHAAANDTVRSFTALDKDVHAVATQVWSDVITLGEQNGYRNSQASVLAPTGCLTGDTMVTTDRGLARLSELGDVWGDRWQGLDTQVSSDEGPQQATQFFVNGEEPTRRIVTKGGYRVQGTLAHRIKVVDPTTGAWEWKRLSDVAADDLVPIQLGTLVGERRDVPLPVLDQAYYSGDRSVTVPDRVDASLAELVGYFMGDGSLHAKGIRLCVADTDLDVIERIRVLSKELFHLEPTVTAKQGHHEVALSSVRLARWWQAAGFAKDLPGVDHVGKGWTPRIPAAIRETNDRAVYAAFLRGLYEADGSVSDGVPTLSTASQLLADDLRAMLLTLGYVSTTRETVSGFGGAQFQVRLRNLGYAVRFGDEVGFLSERKGRLVARERSTQSGNRDRIHLPGAVWDDLVPTGHELRPLVQQAMARGDGLSRDLALQVLAATGDERVEFALGYLFERVAVNEDGGVQPTFDLSVPSNVTYVAAGFVSHNTIGLMMDCDTTGIEPDLALVKFKKMVGGGSLQIVNNTVPRALRKLGYPEETIEAIVEHISQHGNVVDAPGLRPEHESIFDCAMGARTISPMGHVRMMAAAQPFLSGAISKTVNMPETATVEEIEEVYFQGWKLGLKALAIYRDNCKVGQPLSDAKGSSRDNGVKAEVVPETVIEYRPTRKRLPKNRPATTTSFTVGGAEGYMTASRYPDDGLGEIFLKMSKQGSTLAGVMDAFSIAISIGLQYGVPLDTYVKKFVNMRFDPAGMTDDPDVRMAQSMMDYIFRRLALDHLPYESRSALGIYTADERTRYVETGSYEPPAGMESGSIESGSTASGETGDVAAELETLAQSAPVDEAPAVADAPQVAEVTTAHSSTELLEAMQGTASDAPMCFTCGTKMRPAGSCFVCEGCGATSGCS